MKTGCEIVVEYLQSVPAWYLATSDADGQPHVRPFSFVAHLDGRMWFCTSKDKDVYAEMQANPRIGISAWRPASAWIVVEGQADLVDQANETIHRAGFAHMRALGDDFTGSDDPRLTFFSLTDAQAWLCDIDGSRLEVELDFDYDSVELPEDKPAEAPEGSEGPEPAPEDAEAKFAEENFSDVD